MKSKLWGPKIAILFFGIWTTGCTPFQAENGDQASTAGDPVEQFNCQIPGDLSGKDVQRLTSQQIKNTLSSLFSSAVLNSAQKSIDTIPEDVGAENFESHNGLLSDNLLKAMSNISFDIALAVYADINERTQVFGSCSSSLNTTDQNCLQVYLGAFAEKILRKKLSNEEKNKALSIFNAAANPQEGLENVLAYHLQSPQFLILWEEGVGSTAQSVFELTAREVANRVAYMVTDYPPKQDLLSKVENASLKQPEILRQEIEKLMYSPEGKAKTSRLFRYWLGVEGRLDPANIPDQTLGSIKFDEALQKATFDEFNRFIEYIVFDKRAPFQEVLTDKSSFASHPDLASIYGHPPVTGSSPEQVHNERLGLLHKVPFLFTDSQEVNMITRGVKIRRKLLCEVLPTPDASVIDLRDDVPLSDNEKLNMTHREILEFQTQSTSCMACHGSINPSGAAFENFDQIGRLRTVEAKYDDEGGFIKNLHLDTTSLIPLWLGEKLESSQSKDLISKLATSYTVKGCFAKKMYSFVNQRPASLKDQCNMNQVYKNLISEHGSIYSAYVEAVFTSATKKRVGD